MSAYCLAGKGCFNGRARFFHASNQDWKISRLFRVLFEHGHKDLVSLVQNLIGVWLLSVAATAWAAEPAGVHICSDVRGFHDGDTFTCVTDSGPLRVRVAGVDAPEVGQGYWRVSRDLLRTSTPAGSKVHCYKVDRYERQVCRVTGHKGEDVALGLVEAGLAWRTRKYTDEQTQEERNRYLAAESLAREYGLGLWSQEDPLEPSECRALKKKRVKCK